MPTTDRKLRVFLCHSSQDKPIVRELYQRLNAEGWIDAWLDEEKLLPGMDWDMEIEKTVEVTDAVIVCLSNKSVSKEGYIQKELRFVLDISDEKPEDAIFLTPIRLDDCPLPRRLKKWQYVDYFPFDRKDWAYKRLQQSLKIRLEQLAQKEKAEEFARQIPEQKISLAAMESSRNKKEQENEKVKESQYRSSGERNDQSGRLSASANILASDLVKHDLNDSRQIVAQKSIAKDGNHKSDYFDYERWVLAAYLLFWAISSVFFRIPFLDVILGMLGIGEGVLLIYRKQMFVTGAFKVWLLIFLISYALSEFGLLGDPLSYISVGAAFSLIVILVFQSNLPLKIEQYSSVALASFLFINSFGKIAFILGFYNSTIDFVLAFTSVVVAFVVWRYLRIGMDS